MRFWVILPLIILLMLIMVGCAFVTLGDDGEKKDETEEAKTTSECEEHLEMIGLSYYYHHGSMAGMDCNYTITKAQSGAYLFHAELESGNRIVDKEILQSEYDEIMQLVNDNYTLEADAQPDSEFIACDADSKRFMAISADEETQYIDLGKANGEVVSRLEELLD